MKSLGERDLLALQAALLPRTEAVKAWRDLVTGTPWMDLPGPVQRCLAPIAANLGCQSGTVPDSLEEVPHSARLAGVYRATWSANIVRARAMEPLLAAFDEQAIDYRLLKGTAICALTNRWGMRRMGDMDLAVSSAHASVSVSIMRDLGFWPRFFSRIDDTAPPQVSCWEGPGGHILDLHVGDARRKRSSIIDAMFASQPRWVSSQDREWPLPTDEAMAVHAAVHARTGAAVSDHVQAVLDLSLILPRTDPHVLGSLARSLRAAGPVARLQRELVAITARPMAIVGVSLIEPWAATLGRTAADLVRLPQLLKERTPTQPVATGPNVRSSAYRSWRRVGYLGPVERLVARTVGGFLRSGSLDTPRDRRRKIEVAWELRGRPIDLRITCADPYARWIFIDGVPHGFVEHSTTIRVQRAPDSIEVSLRLLGDPPSLELAPLEMSIAEPGEVPVWT